MLEKMLSVTCRTVGTIHGTKRKEKKEKMIWKQKQKRNKNFILQKNIYEL
jgi:hypothetical protein